MEQLSNNETSLLDNHVDDHVDIEIQESIVFFCAIAR